MDRERRSLPMTESIGDGCQCCLWCALMRLQRISWWLVITEESINSQYEVH